MSAATTNAVVVNDNLRSSVDHFKYGASISFKSDTNMIKMLHPR